MKNHNYIPSYLGLKENLFQEKIEQGKSNLENCQVCPRHCGVNRLKEELGEEKLKNKKIAILGLAFKPNTDDMREAPSIPIINLLLKVGANVVATDPIAVEEAKKLLKHKNLSFVTSADEALTDADACVLVTEWREYTHLPNELFLEKMKSPIIIDGRRKYSYEKMREEGIRYRGIGLGQ